MAISKYSKIKNLSLGYNDLSFIRQQLLSESVNKLVRVNLRKTELSSEQCRTILKQSLESETLSDMTLCENDLSSVSCDILVMAVLRLKKIDLEDSWLTM